MAFQRDICTQHFQIKNTVIASQRGARQRSNPVRRMSLLYACMGCILRTGLLRWRAPRWRAMTEGGRMKE